MSDQWSDRDYPSSSRAPQEPAEPQPPGRVTGLGWAVIVGCPVLVAIVFIAGRGTVAVIAFVLLALDVLVLATSFIAPPGRRRRPRPPWPR